MAKDSNKDGKMRDELKNRTSAPDAKKLVETVVGVPSEDPDNASSKEAPKDSAFAAISAAVDKGDPVVSSSGETTAVPVISKPEAEMLARRFNGLTKEATLPLDKTVGEVKKRNVELQKQKASLSQQPSRLIRELRSHDPVGKKTCGCCGRRVPLAVMDSKKELCEVCAS